MRYFFFLIVTITANYAWAGQVPQIVLPEMEFVVFDIEIKNNGTVVNDGDTVYIDAIPTMPDIVANIKPVLLTMGIKYVITYNGGGRSDLKTYQATSAVNTWHVDYGGEFHGGEASITASLGDKYKTKSFHIRGTNPTKATLKSQLNIYQQVMVYKESRWHQFGDQLRLPYITASSQGGYAWGLVQMYSTQPNERQIWNWTTNLSWGISWLSNRYDYGIGYPGRLRAAGYTQARDWNSDEERWMDGFQLYFGFHAYVWVLDDPEGPRSGPGSWQPNPDSRLIPDGESEPYGINAWRIKTNVESGNPPAEWN